MVSPRLVDGRPHCTTQDRSAVHVLYFERSFSFDEQFDGIQVSSIRGPVQGGQSGAGACGRINTLLQQEIGDVGSTIKARAGERFIQCLRLVVKIPLLVPRDDATWVAVER